MKSDKATKKSLRTWITVTEKINLAYGRVLSKNYKKDCRTTIENSVQMHNKMESTLNASKCDSTVTTGNVPNICNSVYTSKSPGTTYKNITINGN